MLNENKERELAYIVQVDSVKPIEGYDRIAYATVGGWHCVVGVDMKAGDKAIYFEIDSLLPSNDERFAFCEKYHYKVKTQRYCKGSCISQGLLLPITEFPEFADAEIGTFVTKQLGVTYYDPMDRARKNKGESTPQYKNWFKKWSKRFPFKQLLNTKLGRKILLPIFTIKKKKHNSWPDFIPKTDEERCQNMPWIVNDKSPYEVTEKVDGASSSFGIRRGKHGKYEYYVCSRNVVFINANITSYYAKNIWWEMYEKYHIQDFLTDFIEKTGADWVYLQGETFGEGVQKREYSLKCRDFRAFILCTSQRVRYSYAETKEILDQYGIPTVPIISTNFIVPDTIDELVAMAHGNSEIDGQLREGLVFRKVDDPTVSWKAVDPEFLMKYHG